MLIASAKFQSLSETSHHPAFLGSFLIISHICLPCLPTGRVSSCVLGLMEVNEDAWGAVNVGYEWDATVFNF